MMRAALLALALFAVGSQGASAEGKIWVGLFLGQNRPPEAGTLPPRDALYGQLQAVFNFTSYRLLQADEVGMHERDHWVMPRNDFFLCLHPRRHEFDGTRRVEYDIYQDGFVIARGSYQPTEDTPLFINGPDFRDGRFIFVLRAH